MQKTKSISKPLAKMGFIYKNATNRGDFYKRFSQVIAGAMLSLTTLTVLGVPVLLAQTPVFLLRAKCVDSGLGSAREETRDVSIGRAVYTSRFYLGPGNRSASITCKITPNNTQSGFQTLQLDFGMRDNDTSPPITVNVYLDGKQAASQTVAPAGRKSLSLDISNVSNVSVETVCSSRSDYCNRVYFTNAALEPKVVPPAPGKKK